MYLYVLSEIELQTLPSIDVPVHNQQSEEPLTQDDDTEGRRLGKDDSSLTSSQTMSSPKVSAKGSPTPPLSTNPSLSSTAKTESETKGSDVVDTEDLSKLDKKAQTPTPLREKPKSPRASKHLSTDYEPE